MNNLSGIIKSSSVDVYFLLRIFFSFNFSSGWVKPPSPVLSRLMRPVDSECTNINEWDFFGPENLMFSVSFILWRICNNIVRDYWCMFWTLCYWFPIDYLTPPSCSVPFSPIFCDNSDRVLSSILIWSCICQCLLEQMFSILFVSLLYCNCMNLF